MSTDMTQLDRDLRALILTATDHLEQEARVLHRVAEALAERAAASMIFSDRFGHLLDEPMALHEPIAHFPRDEETFARLASELAREIGRCS